MDQYSHEELQKVIRRYDEEHKKNRLQILQNNKVLDEKQEQTQQLHQKLSKAQSVAEDIQMYDEEIKRLKEYMNMLSQENDKLKKEQEEREQQLLENAVSGTPSSLAASLTQQKDAEVLQKGLKQKDKMIEALQRKL